MCARPTLLTTSHSPTSSTLSPSPLHECSSVSSGEFSSEMLDRIRRRRCLADKELERAIATPICERPLPVNQPSPLSSSSPSSALVNQNNAQQQKSRLLGLNTAAISKEAAMKNREETLPSSISASSSAAPTQPSAPSKSDNTHHRMQPPRSLFDLYSSLLSQQQQPEHHTSPAALAAMSLIEKLNMFNSYYNQIAANLQEAYAHAAWQANLSHLNLSRHNHHSHHYQSGYDSNGGSTDVSPASTRAETSLTKQDSVANRSIISDFDGDNGEDESVIDDEDASDKFKHINRPRLLVRQQKSYNDDVVVADMSTQNNSKSENTSSSSATRRKSKTNFSVEALLGVVK